MRIEATDQKERAYYKLRRVKALIERMLVRHELRNSSRILILSILGASERRRPEAKSAARVGFDSPLPSRSEINRRRQDRQGHERVVQRQLQPNCNDDSNELDARSRIRLESEPLKNMISDYLIIDCSFTTLTSLNCTILILIFNIDHVSCFHLARNNS